MAKRVTVYDIAKELNISPSTVSRVLNNSALISNERSAQILKAAKKMGYVRRSVKKHVSRAILNIHLFLPVADSTLTHFFYNISELIDSIIEGFNGVRLNINTRLNDGNLDFLSYKKTGYIDGCIFAFTKPDDTLADILNEREIPLVLLNRKSGKHNCVYYDTPEGVQFLAEKLYQKHGPEIHPCFVGFRGLHKLSMERFAGAKKIFDHHEIPFDSHNLYVVEDLNSIVDTVPDWIRKQGFNAVIAFNDMVALSLLQSMMSRGIRIPEDVSLTGFDNSPILKLLDRRINTMSLSIPELGRRAGEWLHAVIIEKQDTRLHEMLPVEYVEGETI